MNALTQITQAEQDDTPSDAYGPGYAIHSIREEFRDLCRMIGREAARQELAEIINAEFEGRRQ